LDTHKQVVPHVDARAMFHGSPQIADRLHEPGALDALGLVELAQCDLVDHAGLLITEHCCENTCFILPESSLQLKNYIDFGY
jgi:hypothetical protein